MRNPIQSTKTTAPESLLAALVGGWTARGWNPKDLGAWRMEDPPTPPPPPAPPAPPPPPPVQFTAEQLAAIKLAGFHSQDDLNRIAAAEKEQGKRQAERDLAEALGVTVDEAKAIIETHKKAEQDAMTETQRQAAAAAEDRQKAAAELVAARADRRGAAVHAALVIAGVVVPEGQNGVDVLDRVGRMVSLPDGDVTPEQATAAVDALKAMVPSLFAAAAPLKPGQKPPPSSGPPAPPAPKPPEGGLKDAFEKGRLAARGNPRAAVVAGANGK